TGSLTGSIVGGNGQDILSFNGYAPSTTGANPVNITLTSLTGSVTPVSATGTASALGGTFSSIENIVGNDVGPSANTVLSSFAPPNNWTWDITNTNAGDVYNDAVGSGAVLPFSQVANLQGGAGNDTFVFKGIAGSLTGLAIGGGGTNVLDY